MLLGTVSVAIMLPCWRDSDWCVFAGFGAKYVARFMAEGKGVDVGYMAHPSFVEPDEVKAMKGPLSISAAGMSSPLLLHLRIARATR